MNRAQKGNFIRVLRTIAKAYIAASPDDREVRIESRRSEGLDMATPEIITDPSSWPRDHPDTAVFRWVPEASPGAVSTGDVSSLQTLTPSHCRAIVIAWHKTNSASNLGGGISAYAGS
jgi:hypothetical protein